MYQSSTVEHSGKGCDKYIFNLPKNCTMPVCQSSTVEHYKEEVIKDSAEQADERFLAVRAMWDAVIGAFMVLVSPGYFRKKKSKRQSGRRSTHTWGLLQANLDKQQD